MNNSLFLRTMMIFLLGAHLLGAQNTVQGRLKSFLWQRDFQELIRTYGEETVVLRDEGLVAEQKRLRSYVEIPGFRVQVFAGTNEQAARAQAHRLEALQLDSVYVVQEGGLYKVQVGNFRERREAEKMLDRLHFAGVDNAWIVATTIHWPKSKLSATAETTAPVSPMREMTPRFAIQIFVTGSADKARRLSQAFAQKMGIKTRVLAQNGFYKVLAGDFTSEAEARTELERLHASGFPDAWVIQLPANPEQ